MRNIKLTLQYDGTSYHGWQSQRKGEVTIQSTVQNCIYQLTGQKARLLGAGRTDAGVHALCQVACFRTGSRFKVNTIKKALNALLPGDIRVTSASEVEDSFHPQYSAAGKRYFYIIANMDYTSPFLERFVWKIPQRLDVADMVRAGRVFEGRHDFRAFMAAGSGVEDTVREIKSLGVYETDGIEFLTAALEGRFIKVVVEGDGFLRYMVRNIVGTLVECAKGKDLSIPEIISSKDRRRAGPTAPAKGLFLEKVMFC